MKKKIDVLEAIDRADPTRARSPLRLWMRDNYAAFAARLESKRPDWGGLAKIFAEADLMDGEGNPPKSETARKTWQRVVADKKRQQTNKPERAPLRSARAVIATPQTSPDEDDDAFFRTVTHPRQ
jgi:hypothetical protein